MRNIGDCRSFPRNLRVLYRCEFNRAIQKRLLIGDLRFPVGNWRMLSFLLVRFWFIRLLDVSLICFIQRDTDLLL